jgi:hypothetical protein
MPPESVTVLSNRPPALRLNPQDNVATAVRALEPADQVLPGVTAQETIPRGHKVAIANIPEGVPVRKLGHCALNGGGMLAVLPFILLLRFGLGAVSYAAGTPGGLFAPLLVVGAQLGLCFGLLCRVAFPELDIAPQGFAVVGMAAFFAGVVRAPLTGITLVVEMTANVTMLLPMLGACFVAMLVPALLRNAPIYDSLREQATRRDASP